MIYIIILIDFYNKNKDYLLSLVNTFYFFRLIIKFSNREIIKFMNDVYNERDKNNNKFIFVNYIDKSVLNAIKIENQNNIYLLNTQLLNNSFFIDYLEKLPKYIKILDKNISNINFFKKDNIGYIPYQILNDNYKNDKKYDICIFNDESYNFIKDKYQSVQILNYDYRNINAKIFIYLFKNGDKIFDEEMITFLLSKGTIIISEASYYYEKYYLSHYIIKVLRENICDEIDKVLLNYDEKNNLEKDIVIKNSSLYFKEQVQTYFGKNYDDKKLGFIFTRHVNSERTNSYWIECYKSIRKIYPHNFIIIIDDNSNYDYVSFPDDLEIYNCDVIQSEYPRCGELLSYYYFYKYHFFEKTFIIHDSTFVNKLIDVEGVDSIKYIWHFTHHWDEPDAEKKLIYKLNYKKELLHFYDEQRWYGCYGLQSVITHSFVKRIFEKYNLMNLVKFIKSRPQRMNLERVFSVVCTYELNKLYDEPSFLSTIHHYLHWGYLFETYMEEKQTNKLDNYPFIKVWSGR
jgi:hypothetical protein